MGEHNFLEDSIYPVTIIEDRYSGSYSGALFLAFHADFWRDDLIPSEIEAGDGVCISFWRNEEEYGKYIIGKGNNPSAAYVDLYKKIKESCQE